MRCHDGFIKLVCGFVFLEARSFQKPLFGSSLKLRSKGDMDVAGGNIVKKKPRKMLCYYCVEKWEESGAGKENQPRQFFPNDVKDGICPDCGNKFRNYVRF